MSGHWYYIGVEPCGCWTSAMVDLAAEPEQHGLTKARAARLIGKMIAETECENPGIRLEYMQLDGVTAGKELASPWPESCPHRTEQMETA